MPYIIVSILLQFACVVHAVRTGRNRFWIGILIFVPMVGCLAYVVFEVLPELFGARVHHLHKTARHMLDPEKALRRCAEDLAAADTVENRRRYAAACQDLGRHAEAIEILESVAVGIHADDTGLLIELARATFAGWPPARTLELLDRVKEIDPSITSADAHLLYARALEALGRDAEAEQEYRALTGYFAGEEARYRLGELLERRGDAVGARTLFDEILARQRRAPGHYREAQRGWVEAARRRAGA
jgi:hypothetical protein